MRTSKETARALLAQIQEVADARMISMMGEYVLYVDEKVVGQINHSEVFIKVTPFGESFVPKLEKEPPYENAKSAFIIPNTRLADVDWLRRFIAGTVKDLPPKKK